MQIFQKIEDKAPDLGRPLVLAIGNFDGIHLGHQALLARARDIASEKNAALAVLTFEPHPRRLFRPDDPPFRITPAGLKTERLAASGVEYLFAVPFTWDFASQSAEKFIETVLDHYLQPVHVVVGFDFCFGQLRKGSPDTLREAGYDVTVFDEFKGDGDARYSSSAVRQFLRHGKIADACEILGWPWEIRGIVKQGDQRGRTIGYPTANVPLEETVHPAYGVYATWVKILDDGPGSAWYPSATNIGIRPMFELQIGQVEAYIFDFDRDIYGCELAIRPVKRLRGEAKYDTLEALIEQIGEDCKNAADILAQNPPEC